MNGDLNAVRRELLASLTGDCPNLTVPYALALLNRFEAHVNGLSPRALSAVGELVEQEGVAAVRSALNHVERRTAL